MLYFHLNVIGEGRFELKFLWEMDFFMDMTQIHKVRQLKLYRMPVDDIATILGCKPNDVRQVEVPTTFLVGTPANKRSGALHNQNIRKRMSTMLDRALDGLDNCLDSDDERVKLQASKTMLDLAWKASDVDDKTRRQFESLDPNVIDIEPKDKGISDIVNDDIQALTAAWDKAEKVPL